jgi:Zn-dependent protease
MLRWRLFGISFCIQPSFWLMNALWAFILYQPVMGPAERGQLFTRDLLILMVVWILCTLVAVMVHELGHVITGRIFGQPGSITLTGLGGQAVGSYDNISRWKRILVIAAGPGAGFLFAFALVAVDGRYWNFCMDWMDWEALKCKWFLIEWVMPDALRARHQVYELSMLILFMINLFMNIMNLLPIIPMDGGMIFKEICCAIFPRHGLKFAFIWSAVLAGALTLYLLIVVLVQYRFMTKPFELYYPFAYPEFSLLVFASLTYQSYAAYRLLAMRERHADYMEDDDFSDPRDLPPNVREVPVKDPRDFAPRAPGSERPRS